MYVKSSPPQQDAVAEAWTADLLVLGQARYYWATLLSSMGAFKDGFPLSRLFKGFKQLLQSLLH